MNICKRTSRLEVLFKIIEWSIYICFCVLAAIFVKGVWDQYHAKETFLGQSLEPFTELPSVILCLKTPWAWSYSKGNIKIEHKDNSDGTVYQTLIENEPRYMSESNESVIMHQVKSNCFRVKFTPGLSIDKSRNRYLKVRFLKSEPSAVIAYFASEENSFGQFNGDWYDGKVYRKEILPGHLVYLDISQKKYTHLDQDDQCSHQTFVQQWMPYLLKANFSEAPKKCANNYFLETQGFPLCGWGDGQNKTIRNAAYKVIIASYGNFIKKIGHKRPCHVIEYSGQTTSDNYLNRLGEKEFEMKFQFGSPGMTLHYTERYVFDTLPFVGSVGGTLGMCIGFSFFGLISTVLDSIKSRMKSYF